MAEKAIERFSPTSALNELGDRYHYMIEQPAGSWMRYDAELVRDAMRWRHIRTMPVVDAQAIFWLNTDRKRRDKAIDTAISHSGRAQR